MNITMAESLDSLRSTPHSATNSTATPTDHWSFMRPIYLSTYYLYEKESRKLRDIEMYKNRHNKLRLIDSLFNNKYVNKTILLYFISLTKAILFSLPLFHLIICIKYFLLLYQNQSNSFASKYCGDVMSINCLSFLCMLKSL
eukprot:457661_1